MAKFCPACKKEYADEAAFCGDCGVNLVEAAAPVVEEDKNFTVSAYQQTPAENYQQPAPVYENAPYQQQYQSAPQQYAYQQPAPQPQPQYVYQQVPVQESAPVKEEKKEELYPAVSTAAYFWLNIVMAIPFVGFILSIVLTCAPRNRSLKNYARAYLIMYIIGIVLVLIPFIVAGILGVGFELESLF